MLVDLQEQYFKQLTSFYWQNAQIPDSAMLERLAYYAELVVAKNEVVNLISRKDVDSIIENHIFISAYVSKYIPERSTKFLDLGTGGGFPGIPLAIMRPDLKGVLVDATTKKIDAVKEFINKLKLSNVVAENARVENPEFTVNYKDYFDLVVSRATVPIIMLIKYALPLIKDKAYILAIKGGDLQDEFMKAEIKFKPYIKKSTIFELNYKPTNMRNEKGKKLVLLELNK